MKAFGAAFHQVVCIFNINWIMSQVMRGYPDGQGPKLVENGDGIEAMERFQFHENELMRNMANGLVDKYFGEDYGLE